MAEGPQPFFAKRRSDGDRTVVEVGGDCDMSSLAELNAALATSLAEPPAHVVVDFRQVTFVDSVTLGALTAASKRARAGGGSFEVVGVTAEEVRHAFELTGLDDYLLADSRR